MSFFIQALEDVADLLEPFNFRPSDTEDECLTCMKGRHFQLNPSRYDRVTTCEVLSHFKILEVGEGMVCDRYDYNSSGFNR